METKLDRFKVFNFKSIEESDWIDGSDNFRLEQMKTN